MKYYWNGQDWTEREPARAAPGITIIRDLPGYKSPLGTGYIDGRAARREDLKKHGCREVDPSEFRFQPRNPRHFDKAHERRDK